MTLNEARAECKRYLDYLERQRTMANAMLRLASDRRKGICDDAERDRRLAEIQGHNLNVYNGAELEKAIIVLLEAAPKE